MNVEVASHTSMSWGTSIFYFSILDMKMVILLYLMYVCYHSRILEITAAHRDFSELTLIPNIHLCHSNHGPKLSRFVLFSFF